MTSCSILIEFSHFIELFFPDFPPNRKFAVVNIKQKFLGSDKENIFTFYSRQK